MQSISKRTDDILTSVPSQSNNKESWQHELGDNTVVFDYIPLIYMRDQSVVFGGNWNLKSMSSMRAGAVVPVPSHVLSISALFEMYHAAVFHTLIYIEGPFGRAIF